MLQIVLNNLVHSHMTVSINIQIVLEMLETDNGTDVVNWKLISLVYHVHEMVLMMELTCLYARVRVIKIGLHVF